MSTEKPTLVKIDNWPVDTWLWRLLMYWGGMSYIVRQPGFDFWDGLIWPWYIGRYIAAHFAMLTLN